MESSTLSGAGKTRKREDSHGSPTKGTRTKIPKGSNEPNTDKENSNSCLLTPTAFGRGGLGLQRPMDLRNGAGSARTRHTRTVTRQREQRRWRQVGAATAGGMVGAVAAETATTTGAAAAAVTAGARAGMGTHTVTPAQLQLFRFRRGIIRAGLPPRTTRKAQRELPTGSNNQQKLGL